MKYADNNCQYREKYENGQHVFVFRGPCVVTGEEYEVVVPAEGLFRYRQGALIQDAFPEMSAGDREFLISGLSPVAFDLVTNQKRR